MKILFLSRWFPFPANNGAKLRISGLLKGLSKYHEISLISFRNREEGAQITDEARSICRSVKTVLWREYNPRSIRSIMGYFSSTPRSLIDNYSPEMAREIQNSLKEHFDLVIASELQMADYVKFFQGSPCIFEELESGIYYQKTKNASSALSLVKGTLTWLKYRQYIANLLKRYHACTVVSGEEKALLAQIAPNYHKVEIIQNGIDLSSYQVRNPTVEPYTMVFTGSFRYSVNYSAALWFAENVYPLVKSKFPAAKLIITGDHANLPFPTTEGITLSGYVDDIKPVVANSTVSVVPILSGGGTRLKILEAMALRTPVVSTHKGAEGLKAERNKEILLADTPEEFAANIGKLFTNPALRDQLATNGYALVKAYYDWDIIMPTYYHLIQDVVSGKVQ